MMLDLDEVNEFFGEHFTRSAFRLEVMDFYAVDSDGDEYNRYVRGDDPEPGFKEQWTDVLRAETAAGKLWQRVRVLTPPLGDYLRYECEWGYAPNVAAGEQVLVLDLSETAMPAGVVEEEFWILDDAHVLRMLYDDGGAFVGADIKHDVERYRAARDAAIAVAEDFTSWWERHPEEHRDNWRGTAS